MESTVSTMSLNYQVSRRGKRSVDKGVGIKGEVRGVNAPNLASSSRSIISRDTSLFCRGG
jgi:hypothetical protein